MRFTIGAVEVGTFLMDFVPRSVAQTREGLAAASVSAPRVRKTRRDLSETMMSTTSERHWKEKKGMDAG
jgi:hypothetical protein